MTENEIIKALECCVTQDDKSCSDCPIEKSVREGKWCDTLLIENTINLITRLTKSKEHYQDNVMYLSKECDKLQEEITRLQAENKDLAETIHNLTIEKDALFDKAEELKAEVERLKEQDWDLPKRHLKG